MYFLHIYKNKTLKPTGDILRRGRGWTKLGYIIWIYGNVTIKPLYNYCKLITFSKQRYSVRVLILVSSYDLSVPFYKIRQKYELRLFEELVH
jgi:hypothetical protein